ncbi:MAG: cation transporter dimerization domain-containing protein, partial [Vicinamibacterales bacterium]
TAWHVARDTSKILSDRVVLAEEEIRSVVMGVTEVLGCHQIRSRGSADHIFLDLHVWFRGDTTLHEAHRLSHVVKDRVRDAFPQIADAIIHIEPPPGP